MNNHQKIIGLHVVIPLNYRDGLFSKIAFHEETTILGQIYEDYSTWRTNDQIMMSRGWRGGGVINDKYDECMVQLVYLN